MVVQYVASYETKIVSEYLLLKVGMTKWFLPSIVSSQGLFYIPLDSSIVSVAFLGFDASLNS